MYKRIDSRRMRLRRHRRVRQRLAGAAERPRLAVFRSGQHIYAQVIDDTQGRTLVAASSLDAGLRSLEGTKTVRAESVGKLVAQRAREKGIDTVVFDRGGFPYHGRVKALAEAARSEGLVF